MHEHLQKAVDEIVNHHRKIIDDWCKAYMAQLYEEGCCLMPGDFTLNEQINFVHENGQLVKRYWFEKGVPHYHPKENIHENT